MVKAVMTYLLPEPQTLFPATLLPQSFPPLNSLFNSPNLPSSTALTPGNSDTSLANSDGPLANSNAFPAALGTSPASSEPLGPSPTVPDAKSITTILGQPTSPADPIMIPSTTSPINSHCITSTLPSPPPPAPPPTKIDYNTTNPISNQLLDDFCGTPLTPPSPSSLTMI
ncbi:hypothetical protein E4T56_gene3193 [Termitomyces sp. T112]|nr:hypothetical protein E4T56_gene3193 [Termitomyces sp. T112]